MAIRRSVLMLLTAILTIAMTATTAQAASFHPMKNYGNNKCLDVATENNYLVQLWHCSGGGEQQWWVTDLGNGYLEFRNNRTQACLGTDGQSPAVEARVVVQPCGSASTSWQVVVNVSTGRQLRNRNSPFCLDLWDNSSKDGTPIWMWWCTNQAVEINTAQLWLF